jgi:GntR family transcriptional repressor for pyruvate dehydrogenase complex
LSSLSGREHFSTLLVVGHLERIRLDIGTCQKYLLREIGQASYPQYEAVVPSMPEFGPVPQIRLAREIAKRLSAMILEGELEAGARLPPERELSAKLQVSRPTLREAIHVLEAQGLVAVRPGGGTFVSRKPSALSSHLLGQMLHRDDRLMLELVEVRKEFEVRNAELAAQHASDADVHSLAEILSEMEVETAAGRDRYELDVDFHLLLAEATHNRVRLFITTSLLLAHFELLRDARMRLVRQQRQLLGDFLQEHQAIHLALRDRNPVRAREAMLSHLEVVQGLYERLLSGPGAAGHEQAAAVGEAEPSPPATARP